MYQWTYPATATLTFIKSGYSVHYIPIKANPPKSSRINPPRDRMRFLIIIFRIAVFFSPLRVFPPISAFFFLIDLGYYIYT
jgi:hypothetical protein